MMITSQEPSLKGFVLESGGGIRPEFCAPDPVIGQVVAEIQHGVLLLLKTMPAFC